MAGHFDHVAISATPAELAAAVANWLIELVARTPGRVSMALSGGETPKALYEHLAAAPCRERFDWQRVHWFWGDERCVPHDDAASNFRMVREAMLDKAPVPAGNVHVFPVAGPPAEMAAAYETELKSFYAATALDPARPLFDVVLLGLGTDGHTASLFPGSPALDERTRWAAPATAPNGQPRLTLTYPALESCRHAVFLVAGEGKRTMLARLQNGDQSLPAARIKPVGKRWLFADAPAMPAK